MLLKTCKETSLEITLQGVINVKNLLSNVHGFSPYQLVFGMNTRPPNILSNGPPALEGLSESKITASILRSMHEARKAFIKSESSEKISCALRHNLRSYKDAIFTTGVDIYYMRNNSKRWKGPGKVTGVDGQQILVKHGSFYITCHWSHVILKDEDVRKRTLRSSHITANSDAQDQSMNDNSTLALMHKIEMLVMIITQILCNGPMIVMMIAKNIMILNDKKQCAVSRSYCHWL